MNTALRAGSSSAHYAIENAHNAPALLEPQATIDAAQVLLLEKAIDQQGDAAMKLLASARRGVGQVVDITG